MARRSRVHHHPCRYAGIGCTHTLPCEGDLERNEDGHPPVICRAYHDDSGRINAVPCEDCTDSVCQSCGAVTRLEGHDRGCDQVAGKSMEAHA